MLSNYKTHTVQLNQRRHGDRAQVQTIYNLTLVELCGNPSFYNRMGGLFFKYQVLIVPIDDRAICRVWRVSCLS